jgi:hypothetical protein
MSFPKFVLDTLINQCILSSIISWHRNKNVMSVLLTQLMVAITAGKTLHYNISIYFIRKLLFIHRFKISMMSLCAY